MNNPREVFNLDSYVLPDGVDYRSASPMSCFPAAIAYMMYRLNAPRELWQPMAIDKLTNRRPGELTYQEDEAWIALLEQGAHITSVTDFDAQALQRDGYDYLAKHHADWSQDDPQGFATYWSPEQVADLQRRSASFGERVKAYGQQWLDVAETPTLDHVSSFLSDDSMVFHNGRMPTPGSSHSIVVIDRQPLAANPELDYLAYFANPGYFKYGLDTPIEACVTEVFEALIFEPAHGILAVERPA